MRNGDRESYVQGGMNDGEPLAGAAPGRAARRGGVWRRSLEYAGVLVVALGGTAVVYAAAVGDRDIVEVLAFLVVAAVLYQLLVAWVAGPIRDTRPAVVVGRGVPLLVALSGALVLAWPRGDWIPDNDPAVTDAFVSPSVNLAQVWIHFLPGYAALVLVLLVALRVGHRLGTPSLPASSGTAAAPGDAGRPRWIPVGEAADLLVMGLPMAVILLVEGLLPLPGDGLAYNLAVLVAGAWCAVSTLAGAVRLTRRAARRAR